MGHSWWLEAFLLSVTLVLLIGYWLKRKDDYFRNMDLPYIPLLPSFALTMKMVMLRMSFVEFMDTIYRRLEGHKIGGCFLGTGAAMVARDPVLLNRILIKDFSYFHDRGAPVDTEVNPLEGHLFNMEGKEWRALRNKLSPTFTSGKLKAMLPQIAECADQLLKILRETCLEEDVQIRDLMSRLSIDVIGSCAFGVESGALKDPNCEFRRMANKIFKPSFVIKFKNIFRFFFPKISIWLKTKTVDDDVNDFFFNITRQAFEHRLKTGSRRNDFLDLLLQLKQKGRVDCDPRELAEDEGKGAEGDGEPDTGKLELTDGLLAAQSFIFLVAGWENTASLLSFCLVMFSTHQDAQDKARTEIEDVKGRYSGEITYSALRDMVYLDACVSETLRLYSPIFALFRTCSKDYILEEGVVIKKGTGVIVPGSSIQLDSTYFRDPELFLPERFLQEDEVNKNTFLPFGIGPRICIARRFVLLEVKMVLAKILDSFKILKSPKLKEPLTMDASFTVDIKGGAWVRFQDIVK